MPVIKEVIAIVGEYNGKPKYRRVGSVIEKGDKQYLKLDHLVTTHENGSTVAFFNLYDPKPRQENVSHSQHNTAKQDGFQPQGADFDDNIPF